MNECKCLVCGCCAADHNGWAHPWTGDIELLLTAASEAIRQKWSGDRMKTRIGEQVGELACELLNERVRNRDGE